MGAGSRRPDNRRSGVATGVFNAVIVCVLKLPSIIATLGTFSILAGRVASPPRFPRGSHRSDAIDGLKRSVGFVPVAFIAVVVLAVLGDAWLYRTRSGLALRAVGLDETSSRRLGMATGRMVFLAFVVCSLMASLAGFFLAAQVQIGSPLIGNFGLESIACRRARRSEPRRGAEDRLSERCSPRSSSR